MAQVKTFRAEFGSSVEIRKVWYKFTAAIELELTPDDDPPEVIEKAWNTVINEVEIQLEHVARQNQ
jgi:hypothetical protein